MNKYHGGCRKPYRVGETINRIKIMKKNDSKKELHSRREFFKRAAKGALPIIGAIILASAPSLLNAAEKTPMDCGYSCKGSCSGGCDGSCQWGCGGTCKGTCDSGCRTTCTSGCRWSSR